MSIFRFLILRKQVRLDLSLHLGIVAPVGGPPCLYCFFVSSSCFLLFLRSSLSLLLYPLFGTLHLLPIDVSDLGEAHGIHVVDDGIVALLRKGAKAIVLLEDGAVDFRGVSGRDEGCKRGERRKDGFSHALI